MYVEDTCRCVPHQAFLMSHQIWLTFAPVADQSAQYLDATLEQINWLSMVYMVVAIPFSFGTSWMLDTLGLRITVQTAT